MVIDCSATMAGRHQVGTVTAVTLPLLSTGAAKRSLKSNSAFLINSSSFAANAGRLRGHCEGHNQPAGVQLRPAAWRITPRLAAVSSPPLWRGLQPWATRAAGVPHNTENVLGSCLFLSSRKTQHHHAFSFSLAASDSCSFHC